MKRATLIVVLFACGPGPTEPNTPPSTAPTSTSTTTKVTPTRSVHADSACTMKAMDKLASTIADAGMRKDLDASVAEEEVEPADARTVMRKLEPKLTACNPSEVEGCVFFVTNVETDGHVSAVEVFVEDGLPRDVVACLAGALTKEARFAAVPKAGKMTVPVTFTRTR